MYTTTTMKKHLTINTEVIQYPGMTWYFAAIPKKLSDEIKAEYASVRKGWGALPVTVTIGVTTWTTSIFPDTKSGGYLLPLKVEVRKKEVLTIGKKVQVTIKLP